MVELAFSAEFSYVDPEGSDRPFLEVEYGASPRGEFLRVFSLVDSGSSICMSDVTMADALGIERDPEQDDVPLATNRQPIPGWYGFVFIRIPSIDFSARPRAFFAETERQYPIVGIEGVLSRLAVAFRPRDRRLWLAKL